MKSLTSINCIILATTVLLSHSANGAHILFMHACSTYSHRVAEWPLIDGLLAKGHSVTFISPWGPSGSLTNPKVKEIVPQPLQKLALELLASNFDVNYRAYGILPPLCLVLDLFCYQLCEAALSSQEIQGWLQTKPKVDLVIGDMVSECSLGMAQKLGAKHVLFSPIPLITENFEYLGISSESGSVPDYDLTRPTPLGFFARVTGALLPLHYLMLDYIFYPWYSALFKRTLGLDKVPGVHEMRDKTDLILINGDYISDYPRSWPPLVVKVEGIHIKKNGQTKPLPKEIEAFINSKGPNTEGFVFLSFGTVAKAPNLPPELKEIFFNAIKSFPNINFIWKWDGKKPEPEQYPKNLFLVPWVDQQDLLAHPKIRGFLTQAGRPSTQEALYHEVPTITFPILADQDFNAARSSELGVSILLDFVGLTEEKLKNAMTEIFSNKKYKDRVVQIANLARDVPMDPINLAIWWVEFVLRHSKDELDLMKPLGRHLTWYQKRNLDVWIFILILSIAMSYLTYYICKIFFNRCIVKRKNATPSNTGGLSNSSKKSN